MITNDQRMVLNKSKLIRMGNCTQFLQNNNELNNNNNK